MKLAVNQSQCVKAKRAETARERKSVGEAEEDDTQGAELVALGEVHKQPRERDEANGDQTAGEAEGAREEVPALGDHQPGPRQDGEVRDGKDTKDRARGGAPPAGRAAGETESEVQDEERKDGDGAWDDHPEE